MKRGAAAILAVLLLALVIGLLLQSGVLSDTAEQSPEEESPVIEIGFSVFSSDQGNVVEFDLVPDASVYAIYRREQEGQKWQKIGRVRREYNQTPQKNTMFSFVDEGVFDPFYYMVSVTGKPSRAVQGRKASEKLLVCVGDSLTQGFGVLETRRTDAWPALVEEEIREEGWGVLNCGYSGSSAENHDDKPYFDSRFYRNSLKARGDIYIVMLGTNDADFAAFDADAYKSDLVEILRSYTGKENQPDVYLCLPPASFRKDRREWVYRESVFPILVEIAREEGVKLIDLHTPTVGDAEHFPDGLHPDAEENMKMAELIMKAVQFN